MIICEICGNVIPDTAAVCLFCGTLSVFNRTSIHTPNEYGFGSPPAHRPDDEQDYPLDPQAHYAPIPGYNQSADLLSMIYSSKLTMTPLALAAGPTVKRGALIAEILLSLCLGIFGVGWMMAGEALAGLLLMACSVLIYWPLVILSAILSLTLNIGPGLGTLLPLALLALSLNALLLKKTIKRKEQSLYVISTS